MAAILPKYKKFRFLTIRQGYYFGEIDLLFSSNLRNYTYIAVTDCEFFVLSKRHFQKLFLVQFRDIGMEFIEHAFLRAKRTEKIY